MYVRQNSWIENGPRPPAVAVPVPRVYAQRPGCRRRGVGAVTVGAAYGPAYDVVCGPNPCAWYDYLSPISAGCVAYGKCLATQPVPAPPPAAAPGAPQTLDQMTIASGTPGGYSAEQSAADAQAATRQAYIDFYNSLDTGPPAPPAGPVNLGWLGTAALIAGAVLVGGVVLGRR